MRRRRAVMSLAARARAACAAAPPAPSSRPGAQLVSVVAGAPGAGRRGHARASTSRGDGTLRRVPDPGAQPLRRRRSGPAGRSSATGGIFRRDLVTGALELVALGDVTPTTERRLVTLGAQNPSISARRALRRRSRPRDQLVAADANTRIDVYVRDMDQPIGIPGRVRAGLRARRRRRSRRPTAVPRQPSRAPRSPPSAALSADGRKVVFAHPGALGPAGRRPSPPCRSGQLFVRDLDANTTDARDAQQGRRHAGRRRASARRARRRSAPTARPSPGPAERGAADRIQPGEIETATYYLWRRVADGPAAPTRRITGAVGRGRPGCAESDTVDQRRERRPALLRAAGNPEDSPPGALPSVVPR